MDLLHLETDFMTAIVRFYVAGRQSTHPGGLDESMQHARLRQVTSKL